MIERFYDSDDQQVLVNISGITLFILLAAMRLGMDLLPVLIACLLSWQAMLMALIVVEVFQCE